MLEILGLPRAARLLDLGCGWGRHAIELARGDWDLSPFTHEAERLIVLARPR